MGEVVRRLTIPPAEVERMRERFGDKVLKMGHLQEDGSMLVPVDCVLEAAQLLGTRALTEAAEILKSDEMVGMLQSGETLVERVGEVRERKLRELIRLRRGLPGLTRAAHGLEAPFCVKSRRAMW